MIAIPLNGEHVTIIDDIDADVADFKWYPSIGKNQVPRYAFRGQSGHIVLMHRVILERIVGRSLKSNECTDHINGNGLDNRRSNLRIASTSQNHYNRRKLKILMGKPTTSKYKGVRWENDRKRWRVDIRIDGKKKFLGRFTSEIEAALAYNRAASSAFGEYARLNDSRRANTEITPRMGS